jgi:hypothetical protein
MPGLAVSLKRCLAFCLVFAILWLVYRRNGPVAKSYPPDRHAYYAGLYGGRKDLQPVVVYREGRGEREENFTETIIVADLGFKSRIQGLKDSGSTSKN